MQAAWYERNGPARDVLQVGELADPVPGPGEVLVRISASGVNPSDCKARSGSRPMASPRVIPHSDGAGVIRQVGSGVAEKRIGERVWLWNAQWKRPFGTASELVALPSTQCVAVAERTSFAEGACLGVPALTAHRAVTADGSPKGQVVLVSGGAGAVGHYAIQFAKRLGAKQVIATVSSASKADHARDAGANFTIDYRRENVVDRIRDITNGRGVDRIVEVDIAGNAKLLPHIIARDGLVVVYGSCAAHPAFEFWPMILSGAAVRFFIVYELPDTARELAIRDRSGWMAQGVIRHAIAAEFQLNQIVDAHEAVESGQLIGNAVLVL